MDDFGDHLNWGQGLNFLRNRNDDDNNNNNNDNTFFSNVIALTKHIILFL